MLQSHPCGCVSFISPHFLTSSFTFDCGCVHTDGLLSGLLSDLLWMHDVILSPPFCEIKVVQGPHSTEAQIRRDVGF